VWLVQALARIVSEADNLDALVRMYSEVYRTHLRTYLEALLRNVDEWARAEQSLASVEYDEPQALTPRRD
jgi:hypothetical protein